jgi:hypothetical protein
MLIIGLGHKARRGKDTLAQHLIQAYPKMDIRRYAFADELKLEVTIACREKFGYLPRAEAMQRLCQWAGVEYDPSPDQTDPLCPYGKQRKLLQWWGTEYRRYENDNYWVEKLEQTVMQDDPAVALVTDVRFPNEGEWIRAAEGFTVRLDRPGFEELGAIGHISETAMDSYPYDFIVTANTVEELKKNGQAIFENIRTIEGL